MNISIVGTGYVGLVSGTCLAEKGHNVICVDKDSEKVRMINNSQSPIYEKGLDELLQKNVLKNLRATNDLEFAVENTDITFVVVGTPYNGSDIDLTYIKDVSVQIGKVLKHKNKYHLVVIKSTVTPGTTDEVVLPILEQSSLKKAGIDFGLSMNPEFLREGEAINDFMNPDRIVIGGIDKRSMKILDEVYKSFEGVDKLYVNNKTAEMIKYTANSLLATMISFSNEIGNLCSSLGDIDALDVMRGVQLDRRLSPILDNGDRVYPLFNQYLKAGCGFGGSCFPKDLKALISHGEKKGNNMVLLKSVVEINHNQPFQIINIIKMHFKKIEGLKVALLGLAFKPGTDDIRESPSITILNWLIMNKAIISVYDPVAMDNTKKIYSDSIINFRENLHEAIKDAETVLLLTHWDEFDEIPELIASLKNKPVFIDGRRMIDKNKIENYTGIGL